MKKILLACLFIALPALASAAPYATRLERLKETRILVAGYRETAIPFSYMHNGKAIGFGVDLTERIAAGLRTKLETPDLRIRWNAVTLSTRIPLMTTNTVDLICTSDTHTLEREKQVNFSMSYYIVESGAAVLRNSGIRTYADLKGKRIAVAINSAAEAMLKNDPTLTVLSARSNRYAAQMIQSGKADAYLNDKSIVAGQLLTFADADKYEVISLGGKQETYGCLLPKNDPTFKKAVDDVLVDMMRNGEMKSLYEKWFIAPIPPFGKPLNLPFGSDIENLYLSPSDLPAQ